MTTPVSLSVLVRTCDRPKLLARALGSLAAQSRRPDEVIVVNDGSSPLVIENFESDKFPKFEITDGPRRGRSAALNSGVRQAHGSWLAVLDDDDTWETNFVAEMLDYVAANPSCNAVACQTTVILEEIDIHGHIREVERTSLNPEFSVVNLLSLAAWNQFTINAVMVSRGVWDEVGPFREDIPVLEDWEFNLRLAKNHEIAVIPHALAHYRKRIGNTGTSANTNPLEHEQVRQRLINEWLREDLRLGRIGFGYLAALGSVQREVRRVHPLAAAYERLRTRWRRFRGYRL